MKLLIANLFYIKISHFLNSMIIHYKKKNKSLFPKLFWCIVFGIKNVPMVGMERGDWKFRY